MKTLEAKTINRGTPTPEENTPSRAQGALGARYANFVVVACTVQQAVAGQWSGMAETSEALDFLKDDPLLDDSNE